MPESPRWLISRDRYQEGQLSYLSHRLPLGVESNIPCLPSDLTDEFITGMAVLENLHRTLEDPEAREAHIEYRQIKSQLELEAREHLGGLVAMFRKPSMRKRLIYGFYLQWLLQSTGVLVIFNYQVSAGSAERARA